MPLASLTRSLTQSVSAWDTQHNSAGCAISAVSARRAVKGNIGPKYIIIFYSSKNRPSILLCITYYNVKYIILPAGLPPRANKIRLDKFPRPHARAVMAACFAQTGPALYKTPLLDARANDAALWPGRALFFQRSAQEIHNESERELWCCASACDCVFVYVWCSREPYT